jgi:hypothetical protein
VLGAESVEEKARLLPAKRRVEVTWVKKWAKGVGRNEVEGKAVVGPVCEKREQVTRNEENG